MIHPLNRREKEVEIKKEKEKRSSFAF